MTRTKAAASPSVEARRELGEAIRLDPGYAAAHHSLGALMSREGRVDEAIAQLTEAIRLRPDPPQLRGNLDIAMTERRSGGRQ